MNRCKRIKNNNYTTISNVFLRDNNLSIKGKGFLAVIMGLPEDWDFSIRSICSILKEGKTAVYNVISELKEKGYCSVETLRDDKGLILGNDYSFAEEPIYLNQEIDIPYDEEPYPDFRDADNKPQLNTEDIKELSNKVNNNICDFSNFISEFNKLRGSKFRELDKVKKQYCSRINDGYSQEDMINALNIAMKQKNHIDLKYKYLTPEFITRSDKLDMFLNMGNDTQSKNVERNYDEEF